MQGVGDVRDQCRMGEDFPETGLRVVVSIHRSGKCCVNLTSVFNSARRHLIVSSKTVSSISVSFLRLPPLLTSRASRSLRMFMPDSVVTNSSIHARLAVDKWTRRDIRCFTSLVSVVRPLRIPEAYQPAVFSASLDLSPAAPFSPPEDAYQLVHMLPVDWGRRGAGSTAFSAGDFRETMESLRLPRSTLERGESGGPLGGDTDPVLHPAMENRFMMPESPVSWGTRRGSMAAALAGPYVDGIAEDLLALAPALLDSVEARDTWFCSSRYRFCSGGRRYMASRLGPLSPKSS